MRRYLPQSLAGRLIVLILATLIASQALSALVFIFERRAALRELGIENVVQRTAQIVRLIEATPVALREELLRTAGARRLRYWIDAEPVVEASGGDSEENDLVTALSRQLGPSATEVRADYRVIEPRRHGDHDGRPSERRERTRRSERSWFGRPSIDALSLSIHLSDGSWLNVTQAELPGPGVWSPSAVISLITSALGIAAIVLLVVRRITRPLSDLALAADRLGRGEAGAPLVVAGPREIRRTTEAFNTMQARLKRFVEDRTQMLAAISHDLRTPITSLRLRAELVEDEETRERMIETLDDMERMSEATLAFARGEADPEATRKVDLGALVASIADDLADLGLDVTMAGREDDAEPERVTVAARPAALKRALRNIVENAAKYGLRARISLSIDHRSRTATLIVDDDGPGIPEADMENVFKPFVRLERSRNVETGGVGLGLAIARSILRGHGGDVELQNRKEGGLRARIGLPLG
ncbi:MAG: ATP-binding protein [Hyphomicrobiaceae bacterium]